MNVGILGGGQLGRMLALAGRPLGVEFRFLEPGQDPPVRDLGPVTALPFDCADDAWPEELDAFVDGLDVITYEFENVPVTLARALQVHVPVHPRPAALEMAQDRIAEKEGFRDLGIETPEFVRVDSDQDAVEAGSALGYPYVLKTRRFGYDGKGQSVIRSQEQAASAWSDLGGVPAIAEAFVPFDRELSVVAAFPEVGAPAVYPLAENHHEDGILRVSRAPAPELTPGLTALATDYVTRVARHLEYRGVVALELFQVGERLLANEMAPRVHNSGHWTQDGAWTCQFENHVRAVLGWPLGDPGARAGTTVMTNLIGTVPPTEEVLGDSHAHLHLYGKASRPGRKLGHVNRVERRTT